MTTERGDGEHGPMERVHGQQRTYVAPKLEVVGSIADVTGGNTVGPYNDLTRCHTVSAG